MSKPANSKILSLQSILAFGKHKGLTIREIIDNDPHYLDWCIGEQMIELDNTAYQALQIELKQNNSRYL